MMNAKAQGFARHARSAETARTDTILMFVKWCQGRADTRTTLKKIGAQLGAEVIALSRWEPDKRILRLASAVDVGEIDHGPSLSRGFADTVCGKYLDSLKPGAVLLLGEVTDGAPVTDPRLAQWIFKRNIKDIAIICLGKSNQHHDIVELHFGPQFARKPALLDDILAHALADVYAGRREGLMVTALSGANRRAKLSGTPCERSQPLLSLANPAGLTRMEWKVCALVANGLSREGVAKELCIKPSTVQTHLRNIYAKSGFERFHELALHLVSRQERIHLVSAKEEAAA